MAMPPSDERPWVWVVSATSKHPDHEDEYGVAVSITSEMIEHAVIPPLIPIFERISRALGEFEKEHGLTRGRDRFDIERMVLPEDEEE